MAEEQVVVTLKDIYIEVRRLQDSMAAMTPQGLVLADHETRLRGLEKWRYSLPIAILMAFGSLALGAVELVIHH